MRNRMSNQPQKPNPQQPQKPASPGAVPPKPTASAPAASAPKPAAPGAVPQKPVQPGAVPAKPAAPGDVALSKGLVTEDQLLSALAEQFGMKSVNLAEFKFQEEAIKLVPETMAQVYKVIPLTLKDQVLTVAMGDPNNLTALDDLRNFI